MFELGCDEVGRIPCPEEAVGGVEVVLPTGFFVGLAVGERELPGARHVGVGAACAEGVLACARTVLGEGAAVAVLRAAAGGAFSKFFGAAGA